MLRAAGTKWNFLNFKPGLVGGHCIGIDPYYLTYKAEDTGYHSKIILAGRHINDGMGKFIAQHIVKTLVRQQIDFKSAGIGILGLSFKEDCPDIRNSKVIDIVRELQDYGISPLIADPLVDSAQAYHEYGIELSELSDMRNLNVVVVAVAHEQFVSMTVSDFDGMYQSNQSKMMFDIKGAYPKSQYESQGYTYWSL
ncbi:UDP-N-acetyl-D-glucosamine 6-dehydrogenase [compost metagenome]